MRNSKKSLALFGMALLLTGTVLSCKSKEGMNEGSGTDTTAVSTDTTQMTPPPSPTTTDTTAMPTDTTAMPAK